MLRITPADRTTGGACLILEGSLAGPWVAELQSAVISAGASAGHIHLDLAGVAYVDAQGLTLLRRLLEQGLVLQRASPFVEELLNTRPEWPSPGY